METAVCALHCSPIFLARFPLARTVMKSRVIPQGVDNHNIVDIFSGRLPSSIVIGFVLNSAFRGSWTENAYNFQNFGLTEINMLVNSKQ